MRWNPRRRQVTSVVYVRSEKVALEPPVCVPASEPTRLPEPEKPKSPWNSLEVAKIIVGTLIPISVGLSVAYIAHLDKVRDQEKAIRDDLHARRAAMEPVLGDMASHLDAIRDGAINYKMLVQNNLAGKERLSKYLNEARIDVEAFHKHVDDDLPKLRVGIDGTGYYLRTHMLADGLMARVDTFNMCVQNITAKNGLLVDIAKANAQFVACQKEFETPDLVDCMAHIAIRVHNFEQEIKVFYAQSQKACRTDSAPVADAAASAASK